MFKYRSSQTELLDTLDFDSEALIQNLNELESMNRWFGANTILKNGLRKIYTKHLRNKPLATEPIRVVDLGCGGGDLARLIYKWFMRKKINTEIIGIDINPEIVQQAQMRSNKFPEIKYNVHDVFAADFQTMNFDIVCLNNVCHHFSDLNLINLFRSLNNQTQLAIIINDLHRNPFAYLGILLLSRICNLSYLAKNDGPISVLRAFKRSDLEQILSAAGLIEYEISWKFAFRWQVIIWCKKQAY